jgi:hypothetical protein
MASAGLKYPAGSKVCPWSRPCDLAIRPPVSERELEVSLNTVRTHSVNTRRGAAGRPAELTVRSPPITRSPHAIP